MGEHARLARARARQDQQRALAVRDRLPLGLVEVLQQLLEVLCVGVRGHDPEHRCARGSSHASAARDTRPRWRVANIDLARSIYAGWERGDFSRTDWASPEIEFGIVDGPDPLRCTGIAAMAEHWFAFQRSWESLELEAIDYRELDAEHVLVRNRWVGRTRGSALDLSEVPTLQASLMQIRGGKVARLLLYWHAEQAPADLGPTQ